MPTQLNNPYGRAYRGLIPLAEAEAGIATTPRSISAARLAAAIAALGGRPVSVDAGNKSGAVSIDASTAETIKITITGNVSNITVNNLAIGQTVTLWIDNSGSHTISYAGLIADDGTGTLANLDADDYPRVICQRNDNSQVIATNGGVWRT